MTDMKNKGFYKKTMYEVAISAILAAILILLRFSVQMIPGVSFSTVVIIFIAAFLSVRVAIYAGICHYLITGAFLGFGIWVLFQAISVIVIAAVTHFISKERTPLCIYAFLSSFLFGFIMMFSALPFMPLSAIPAYMVADIPFNVSGAVTNLVSMLILYRKNLIVLLQNYRRSYLGLA